MSPTKFSCKNSFFMSTSRLYYPKPTTWNPPAPTGGGFAVFRKSNNGESKEDLLPFKE
jgi:hypothetical protein